MINKWWKEGRTSVTDSFGYVSSTTYDYRFGTALSSTDINSQQIVYTLDDKGRTSAITGPYKLASGNTTIQYSYFPDATVPWAKTSHYDEGRADTIDTATFMDGLKRVLQTKKDTTVDNDRDGIGDEVMVVSGRVIFDEYGRDVKTYYPVTEGLGSAGIFNNSFDVITPTTKTYDVKELIYV